MSSSIIAELRDLGVSYLADRVSLTVGRGERLGLSGESGCGKTTLLRAIAGLLPESAVVTGFLKVWGTVGYIPQEGLNSLSPYLSVGRQVADLCCSHDQAETLLGQVGLGGERYFRSYPCELSGGERQRVLIAQALAMRPRLILADEPTANLDPGTEMLVLSLIDSYVRETGAALVIASHRVNVFRRLGCTVRWMTPEPAAVRAGAVAGQERAGAALVSIRKLSKTYRGRVLALDGVSLEIATGEAVVLAGASGAGKSTLARCLAGREYPDSGRIEWAPAAPPAGPDRVQMVQQEPSESLNPQFTIGEAIRESGALDDPRLLDGIGLPQGWWNRKVSALSEGQRARVAILRTASRVRRGLLILDESLTGLDRVTRSSILSYLDGLRRDRGLSLLLITHDVEVALEAGARVLHLEGGRMVA